jgi:hypothetical protein
MRRMSSRRSVADLGLHGHCALWLHRVARTVRSTSGANEEICRLREVWRRRLG